jgi:CrcB protein
LTATPPPSRLLAAVAVGGALGALGRWALIEAFPAEADGFPWATFGVNVTGALLLALLPAVPRIRRDRTLTVALGPGLLGGFTTLSAYSEQARALWADGNTTVAATYVVGTLAACLLAVALADHWSTAEERAEVAAEGGDE